MKTFLLRVSVGVGLLYVPLRAFAQFYESEGSKDSVQGYIILILEFINFAVLPLLFSIALLFFLINAARYFIISAGEAAAREKARTLALYGIGAFVIMVSIWGIVNMFVYGLEIDGEGSICPDYLGDWCYQNDGYDDYGGYKNEPPNSFKIDKF